MDEKTRLFEHLVREMDPADRWFMKKWLEMVQPAQRVFVVSTRKTGTGPLVLVGAPAEAR